MMMGMYSVGCIIVVHVTCMCWQATCMITYIRDVRGTLEDTSWEGTCQEPWDDCPNTCVTNDDMMKQTCYKCDAVEATCESQFHCSAARKFLGVY